MLDALKDMLTNAIGSRKASFVVGGVVLNLIVVGLLRFGVTLDEATQTSIREAVGNITNAILIYVLSEGGVDVARTIMKKE